jgi:ABC-type bacteriocin/lantibiotic exporter with double-glycine peptidase domain
MAGILFICGLVSVGADTSSSVDMRCGSYCLFLCIRSLSQPTLAFAELERQLGQPTSNGYSLGQLAEAAERNNLHTLAVVTNAERLLARPRPFACIARIDKTHFITLADVRDGNAVVFDPPRTYVLPVETLRARWDGTALLISPKPLLPEEEIVSQSRVGALAVVAFCLAACVAAVVYVRRSRKRG